MVYNLKLHNLLLMLAIGFLITMIPTAWLNNSNPALSLREIHSAAAEEMIGKREKTGEEGISSPEMKFVYQDIFETDGRPQIWVGKDNTAVAENSQVFEVEVVLGNRGELPIGARARLGNGTLTDVVVSKDGQMLYIGGSIGVYAYRMTDFSRVWNFFTQQPIDGITVSPDGETAAVFTGSSMRLVDTLDGRVISEFQTHAGRILEVEYNPSREAVGIVSEYSVSVWDIGSGKQIAEYIHDAGVGDISWSQDGKLLALADSQILLWEPAGDQESAPAMEISRSATQIVWSDDGGLIAAGLTDGSLALWDIQSGVLFETTPAHSLWVNSLDISRDAGQVISGGKDGKIIIWDRKSGEEQRILDGHDGAVEYVKFLEGDRFFSAGLDGQLILWDAYSGEILTSCELFQPAVNAVAWSLDGKWIAAGGMDGVIYLWQADTGQLYQKLVGHQEAIESLVWSQDSSRLASLTSEKALFVWEIPAGELLNKLEHPNSANSEQVFMPDGSPVESEIDTRAYDATFSQNGKYLAAGGNDTRVYIWDLDSGEIVQELEGHMTDVLSVEYISSGEELLSMSYDGTIIYWDTASGKRLDEKVYPGMTSLVIAPDEEYLAMGEWNGHVMLWDSINDLPSQSFNGSSDSIFPAQFSPDGRFLVSGADGDLKTVIIWDTASGEELERFAGHTYDVSGTAISPDGRVLATASWDGTVMLWDIGGDLVSSSLTLAN